MNRMNSKNGEASTGLSSNAHNGEMNKAITRATAEIVTARNTEVRNTSRTLKTVATRNRNSLTERNSPAATTLPSLSATFSCSRKSSGKRVQLSTCEADCTVCATYEA